MGILTDSLTSNNQVESIDEGMPKGIESIDGDTLYRHQREAVNRLVSAKQWGLFDEQGLGKTVSTIGALGELIRDRHIDSVLVVCSKSVVRVWQNHFAKWPVSKTRDWDVTAIADMPKERRARLIASDWEVAITTYDLIHRDLKSWFEKVRTSKKKFAMVVDESQHIKNRKAKRTVACFTMAKCAERRYILTGTPVPEKPDDAWSQIYFLDNGTLLGKYWDFMKRYCKLGSPFSDWHVTGYKQDRLPELADKISSISTRRMKEECLDLPAKVFEHHYTRLKGLETGGYIDALDMMDGALNSFSFDQTITFNQIGTALIAMRKAVSMAKEKSKLVRELVELALPDKTVIWVAFKDTAKAVYKQFARYGCEIHTGDMTRYDRDSAIDRFQKNRKIKVFVSTIQSACTGVTLNAANNVVYWDRTFERGQYVQSQDRVHRIGQKKVCLYHIPIVEGTVDEFTDSLLEMKGELSNSVLDTSFCNRNVSAKKVRWLVDRGRELYG